MTQPPLNYLHPFNYLHPSGHGLHRPPASNLHHTDGLPGNYALDFMAPGGTPVLAPQAGTITRVSGHPVSDYQAGASIMGRSVYLTTSPGKIIYFLTHLADDVTQYAQVGRKVRKGDRIGTVAHWPRDEGRSHTHCGVTHPMGKRSAVARIVAVAKAPMLPFPPL